MWVLLPFESGAKAQTAARAIPVAMKTGNFTMSLNSYIFRINTDSSTGLATSVSYYDAATSLGSSSSGSSIISI